jgi:serine/threonine protein kinase
MAPEIFKKIPYTELGDVFSLGVVYYILLTGKPPFKGNN